MTATYLPFGNGDALPLQGDTPGSYDETPFSEDPVPVGRGGVASGRMAERVEESIDRIRRFGALAMERLADMPRKPDRMTIEIAVNVSAEAGIAVAKCAAETNFRIGMEWEAAGPRSENSGTADVAQIDAGPETFHPGIGVVRQGRPEAAVEGAADPPAS